MAWTFEGKEFTEVIPEMEGFVYLIENTINGKKYVGKKTFWERRKDRKTGRRKKKESNWKDYYGSCDELISDVEVLGEVRFKREILYLCKSKAEMSYLEAREQFERRVLETDDYYNGIINVRVGGSNILRQRLEEHKKAK